MRYLVGLVSALTLLVALPQGVAAQTGEGPKMSAASAVHATPRLPPRLMLRAGYYLCLDAPADTEATSDQTEPNTEKPKSAETDGELATSESNLEAEEMVSSDGPGSEVPDIDTLSQRSIEHYEIRYQSPTGENRNPNRRRRRAIALGVTIPIIVVGAAILIGAAVAVSKSFEDFWEPQAGAFEVQP